MRGIGTIFAMGLAMTLFDPSGFAQTPGLPGYTEGDVSVSTFTFHDGESLDGIRLHYRAFGTPRRDASGQITNAVMIMHGTGGNGGAFLSPGYTDTLFRKGEPLDAHDFYVVLPDAIGHGGSTKPSDGLGPDFPQYDYADMVALQHALLERLGIHHLRILMGMSMGGMNAFQWAVDYPDFASGIMAFACLPVELAGRNRIWRRMAMDSIRRDPVWNAGHYTHQPELGLKGALDLLLIHGSAALPMQVDFPTRELADQRAAGRYGMLGSLDANDLLYAIDASRNYNPEPKLARITAHIVLVNSADDFSNPPILGIAEKEMARIPTGRFHLIPASEKTRGHGTFSQPEYWVDELKTLLADTAN